MGADIHLFMEMHNPKTKKWTIVPGPIETCWFCGGTKKIECDDKPEPCWKCRGKGRCRMSWFDGRNYDLFAILADVRNGYGFAGVPTGEGFKPIAKPRGVPKDASSGYKHEVEQWDGDGHSHTYHTLKHLQDYDWDGQRTIKRGVVSLAEYKQWKDKCAKAGKMVNPDSWCSAISGPGLTFIKTDQADALLASGTVSFTEKVVGEGKHQRLIITCEKEYYVEIRWEIPYRDTVSPDWFDRTMKKMEQLASKCGGPNNVRVVCFFDN